MIEAREREAREAARIDHPAEQPTPPKFVDTQVSPQLANPQPRRVDATPQQSESSASSPRSTLPPKPDPWEAARSKATSDEPQAWAPRAVRRGA